MSTEHTFGSCDCGVCDDCANSGWRPVHEPDQMWERWCSEQDGLDGPPVTSEEGWHA